MTSLLPDKLFELGLSVKRLNPTQCLTLQQLNKIICNTILLIYSSSQEVQRILSDRNPGGGGKQFPCLCCVCFHLMCEIKYEFLKLATSLNAYVASVGHRKAALWLSNHNLLALHMGWRYNSDKFRIQKYMQTLHIDLQF